jgi:hypothetical protein
MQIMGRGRGVNRKAIDPVEIIVLGNVSFIEPDELKEWNALTVDEKMISEGALFENANHAVIAYPWLKSAAAVKMNRNRSKERSVTLSYKSITIGKCYTHRIAQYKQSGKGQKQYSVLFDPRIIGDLRAYLERLVGFQ